VSYIDGVVVIGRVLHSELGIFLLEICVKKKKKKERKLEKMRRVYFKDENVHDFPVLFVGECALELILVSHNATAFSHLVQHINRLFSVQVDVPVRVPINFNQIFVVSGVCGICRVCGICVTE
jgi:hypothetical protein